jgi:uncharacterized protein
MRLVLDTNVVLDWLVFRDPSMDAFQLALADGRLSLVTHQPALDELRRVLAYPQFKLATRMQFEILRDYESRTSLITLSDSLVLPENFPRCRDPDDQHFLALSYHIGDALLVTKDKEVLRLGRRAAKFGLTILNTSQLLARLAVASNEAAS